MQGGLKVQTANCESDGNFKFRSIGKINKTTARITKKKAIPATELVQNYKSEKIVCSICRMPR